MADDLRAERRSSVRVPVALDLQLIRKIGGAVLSQTVDVSTGGARIMCRRPLRIFEELRFELSLQPGLAAVHGTARVLRQDRHDVFSVRFEQVAADARLELESFLGRYESDTV